MTSHQGGSLKRGLQIDLICPPRNTKIKDVEHLFFQCHTAEGVWRLANDHNWVTINVPSDSSNSVQTLVI